MAEPKKRATQTRSGNRRSHLAAKAGVKSACPKCKSNCLPHHVCYECGYYKGNDILQLAEKEKAKAERRKQKESENE